MVCESAGVNLLGDESQSFTHCLIEARCVRRDISALMVQASGGFSVEKQRILVSSICEKPLLGV